MIKKTMKVEIELSYIDQLKAQIESSNKKVKELEKELEKNTEKEWEKRAIKLAHNLLDKYFTVIFKKLGFSQNNSWYREDKSIKWDQYMGDKWYENEDKLTIDFSANVYNGIKQGYLNIGILTNDVNGIREEKTMLSEID